MLSRLWALWGLVAVAPEACSMGAVTLLSAGPLKLQLSYVTLMLCWSISEILRYGFYACKARPPHELCCPNPISACFLPCYEEGEPGRGSCCNSTCSFLCINVVAHVPQCHT